MKKFILISLFIPSLAFASFDRDLFYGLRNDSQVTELQEFLTDQGLYVGPITGNFFALTRKAIKSFQTANLISSTGYFGPLTRAKANSLLSQVVDEAGTPVSPAITAPKTNDDVVAKLLEQIVLLQAQLAELQKQQATLTQQATTLTEQNQKLGAIEVKQMEQTTALKAIQTNTTPPPPPPPPVVPTITFQKIGSSTPILLSNGKWPNTIIGSFKLTYPNASSPRVDIQYDSDLQGTYFRTTTTNGKSFPFCGDNFHCQTAATEEDGIVSIITSELMSLPIGTHTFTITKAPSDKLVIGLPITFTFTVPQSVPISTIGSPLTMSSVPILTVGSPLTVSYVLNPNQTFASSTFPTPRLGSFKVTDDSGHPQSGIGFTYQTDLTSRLYFRIGSDYKNFIRCETHTDCPDMTSPDGVYYIESSDDFRFPVGNHYFRVTGLRVGDRTVIGLPITFTFTVSQ